MSEPKTLDTLNQSTEGGGAITSRAWALLVATGPDAGKRFFFDEIAASRPLLGQSHVCEMQLSDPTISRRHAAFEVTPSALRITDLGSTNGTFVGAVRIVDAYVTNGQSIKVGSSVLQVLELPATGVVSARGPDRFGRVLGRSTVMRRLYPLLERAARSLDPLLIEGETGTGKELIAECIHDAGPRATEPFVVIDCAIAPSRERLEAAFDQAATGTLLLRELGELPLELQPHVAGGVNRKTARILSTTRRDLDKEVQDGRFRDDLYYRIAVLRVEVPPLRARHDDVAVLAQHFHERAGGVGSVPPELARSFDGNAWPGNVRELEMLVTRGVRLGVPIEEEDRNATSDEHDFVTHVLARDLPLTRARDEVIEEFERRYLSRVLARHGGNVGKAAAASGIARRYFQVLRARHRR